MIKKIKRYIYGLTYKESMKILIGICIIITILMTKFITSTSYFTHMIQYDIFTALLYLLTAIGGCLILIIFLLYFYILNIFEKKNKKK